MIYLAYQSQADIMQPVRAFAEQAMRAMNGSLACMNGFAGVSQLRNLAAAYEMLSRAGLSHKRPAFGIDKVMSGNR
jgi:poly(3-hydroxybutyrate) depolymerase